MSAEILDPRFRTIFFSRQAARILGASAEEASEFCGRSTIHRTLEGTADISRITRESGDAWFQHNAPIMRCYVRLNVGVQWGATLLVGQIATSGRLEVTALGDEMNQCARIETAASDGAVLASKCLIERLASDDAGATGLDPDEVAHTPLGEISGVSEKAIRDAGGIPVARI